MAKHKRRKASMVQRSEADSAESAEGRAERRVALERKCRAEMLVMDVFRDSPEFEGAVAAASRGLRAAERAVKEFLKKGGG